MTVKNEITLELETANSTAKIDIWAKRVDKVDMAKPGGWALIGKFLRGHKDEMLVQQNRRLVFVSDLSAQLMNVIVVGAKVQTGMTRRAAFVLFPAHKRGGADRLFPNIIAAHNRGATSIKDNILSSTGNVIARLMLSVNTDEMLVASFVNREGQGSMNSLVVAAQFINNQNLLDRGPPYAQKPTPSASISASDVATIAGELTALPHVHEGLIPIKPKEVKKKKRRARTVTGIDPDKHLLWTKKDKLAVPGKVLLLPETVQYLGEIDGLKMLCHEDKARLMHILADFENVPEEVRELMEEQALLLEGIAAAYRLVAGMGKGEDPTK